MIDAMIISVQEPQLKRCVEAVRNQTVPFDTTYHLDSIIPESEAFKRGMKLVAGKWVMKIDGDMVLYPDAVEIVTAYVNRNDMGVCGYYFGLHDTFLDLNMGYCGVLRTNLYQSVAGERRNRLSEERKTIDILRKKGWVAKKTLKVIVGTHFDKPDEFQVFRKFYCTGVRENDNSFNLNRLNQLREKTGDPLYSLALDAISFAKTKNRYYPGSRNIEFDRKLYEEFKHENLSC